MFVAGWVSEEVRQAAVVRVAAGESPSLVAEDFGVVPKTVYCWMRKAGVAGPSAVRRRGRQDRFEQASGLVRQGVSVSLAACRVGLPVSSVRSWLIEQGVVVPGKAPARTVISDEDKQAAVACVLDGQSAYRVAESLGVAPKTVYSWMRKAGITSDRGTAKQWKHNRRVAEEMFADGVPVAAVADWLGVSRSTVYQWRKDSVMPAPLSTAAVSTAAALTDVDGMRVGVGKRLTTSDRAQIHAGCAQGLSARAIASSIGRHHSVVAREIRRNGWEVIDPAGAVVHTYNAEVAGERTTRRMARPKPRRIDTNHRLRQVVVAGVARRWSPKRISCHLERVFADDETMQLSHEAIYSALYVQGKGSLRAELESIMKTQQVLIKGGTKRTPRHRTAGLATNNRSWITGAEITTRPPEVDDRAIPGHWEGDLVIGKGGKSALITLIERSSRYTLLGHLPDEHSSATVVGTLQRMVKDLNAEQLKTITWDQGSEMALTATMSIADGCKVYFCDPHSPWQRPTNENTNGEIRRRFFPKGTDFALVSAEEVAWVQNELNDTPIVKFHGATPREKLEELFNGGAITA